MKKRKGFPKEIIKSEYKSFQKMKIMQSAVCCSSYGGNRKFNTIQALVPGTVPGTPIEHFGTSTRC